MHRKPEAILTNLLNEIATVKDGFVLVLDDYHVIDTRAVDDAITFLLEHLPPRMHLVVATREDPNLPLPRLRARGQLTGTKRTFVVRPVRAPCTAPELSWFWATCHRR
jgi:LuxR family maltose regulon positive regulatory protein